MQLIIRHPADGLELPKNYHRIIHGIINENLRTKSGFSDRIHDEETGFGPRSFKPYCFSLIHGQREEKGARWAFAGEISYEIRSPDITLIQILAENIHRKGLKYGHTLFPEVEVLTGDYTVEKENLRIRMLSPMTVYSTDIESGKKHWFSPRGKGKGEFAQRINDNFMRKYQNYYGMYPDSPIEINPINNTTDSDEYYTRFKGFQSDLITAWFGEYTLKGERKYLDFLYQSGLGSKNAQGFGMFEVLGEE